MPKLFLPLFVWLGAVVPCGLLAQASIPAPLNDMNHYYLTRQEILSNNFNNTHSNIKPITRREIYKVASAVDTGANASKLEGWQRYVRTDNNDYDTTIRSKKPFLKYFYRSPAHTYEVNTKGFQLKVSPIVAFKGALEKTGDSTNFLYYNARGIQLRGSIDDRVYFYTDIVETQSLFPAYISQRIAEENAVPNAGFYKPFDSRLTPRPNDGYDYLQSQGYIGFNATKHIGFQVGHGRNFIGDGHRSLFLSDFSNNYFYLKVTTKVWKIQYQNLFAELAQDHLPVANVLVPKKYMAAHYLSINVTKNFNIGLFESVIFGKRAGFEFQYLNPIILYRTVEQGLGSPDNVTLGISWKYNFLKRFSFYGQILLDEFVFSELFVQRRGWWGNKFGIQAGLKYINVAGVKGLDLQLELNTVRPYTYTSIDSTSNYTHYNQPLAHPLGANFLEGIGILNYQVLGKLNFRLQTNYSIYGLDSLGSNWGKNIHSSYTTRVQEYGNKIAQGIRTSLLYAQFTGNYEIRHNLFLELQYVLRLQRSAVAAFNSTTQVFSLGFRYNFYEPARDY